MEELVQKNEYNDFTCVYLFFYTYDIISGKILFLLYKEKESDDGYAEINGDILLSDNAPTFAIARILSLKFQGLFTDNNIKTLSELGKITNEDLIPKDSVKWYQVWNCKCYMEWLTKISQNPIQFDSIPGKMIYFLEIPTIIDIEYLNKNLNEIDYPYTFTYIEYSFDQPLPQILSPNTLSLLKMFDMKSHIEQTKKRFEEDDVEYFIVYSCKKSSPDQLGYFHFPALFQGLYRRNNEKWIYQACCDCDLPEGGFLGKCKAIIIPGSDLNVYNDLPILRNTEKCLKNVIDHMEFYPNLKFLGICFGMQILVSALGGKVEKIGEGIFRRNLEKIIIDDQFWNFNFVKMSQIPKVEALNIMEAHGDQITQMPDSLRFKYYILGKSEACENEIFVSEDERILCLQGHPEYDQLFNIGRIAPFFLRFFQKIEPTEEKIEETIQEFLEDAKDKSSNSKEFRKLCYSFLKN